MSRVFRVAIVGGGPGGLFSAWHLAEKAGTTCKITIYEAGDRLGGKIFTDRFAGIGSYEAGVAEIYDYSALGPDPLKELIQKDLDLKIKFIQGGACVLNGCLLQDTAALGECFGAEAQQAADAFRARCVELLSPSAFYSSVRDFENAHPWAAVSADEVLAAEIPNEAARRYVRVMAHSDVAAPPHLTTGLTFLKNALMDAPGYIDIYSVVGGNEQIVNKLAAELDADVRLNSPVMAVEPLEDGTYGLEIALDGSRRSVVADYVVIALPLSALSLIEWRSPALRRAMDRHIAYFDRPGHYLRATLLFQRPFWRETISGAWWMMDAFEGCCVYDEGARHELGQWGALGFLITGNAALALADMPDDRIELLCLDALPPELAIGRELLVDRRVHRWMASVNAVPGGFPARSPYQNHRPNADAYPGLLVVGDYMLDSTLNGALDSAEEATDTLVSDLLHRRRALRLKGRERAAEKPWTHFDRKEIRERLFDVGLLADLLELAWGLGPGARILNLGAGCGWIVGELRALGFDAWGVEPDRLAWSGTPHELKAFNLCEPLSGAALVEKDFDVVLDASLCRLPRDQIPKMLADLRAVARCGVVLGSIACDLAIDLIERYDLLAGVATLVSRWDWSDAFLNMGFAFAFSDPDRLAAAWKRAEAAGAGSGQWYEDAEGLLYSFYSVGAAPAERHIESTSQAEGLGTGDPSEDERILNSGPADRVGERAGRAERGEPWKVQLSPKSRQSTSRPGESGFAPKRNRARRRS